MCKIRQWTGGKSFTVQGKLQREYVCVKAELASLFVLWPVDELCHLPKLRQKENFTDSSAREL